MLKKLFLIVLAIIVFSGCAFYGNKAQYDKGDWYGITTSSEVTRIEQGKLALEKLKSQPIKADSIQGYEGLIANLSRHNLYNFVISGPETKSFLLKSGESVTDKLIPGTYVLTVYRHGHQIGAPWVFHVNAQQHYYQGTKYHWYAYMDH